MIEGMDGLRARLRAVGRTDILLGKVAVAGVANAKRIVRRRTGNLGRTIRVGRVTASYAEVRAGGQLGVGYAGAIEFGARPHVIVPRRARVLAWGGQRTLGGRLRKGSRPTHFARRVNHPGNRPYPYLRPGVIRAVREIGTDAIVTQWNEAA